MKRITIGLVSLALFGGCTTQFFGSPMFPGGAPGCHAHCQQTGMEMNAFVYAGEYSTACICGPRRRPAATAEGTTAASAAVVTMVRAQQQAAAQSHRH
jgi:hypothetical protein